MEKATKRKMTGVLLSIFILILSLTPPAQSYFNLPTEQRLTVGEELKINLNFPQHFLQKLSFYVQTDTGNLLQQNGKVFTERSFKGTDGWPIAAEPGRVNLQMRLFGLIPLKTVAVDVLPETAVVPGGHSIGVLMRSKGVMVIGYSPVVDSKGVKHYPAKEAGIEIGDLIITINGEVVKTDGEAARLIDKLGESGQEIQLRIKRNNKELLITLKPLFCAETKRNRLGLYIRDSAAGVGTLTFYDPKTGYYGALGHIIADAETNKQIALGEGRIINAAIQGINQGEIGRPGEKIGTFLDKTTLSGDIRKNTTFGIFGKLDRHIQNSLYKEPIPVAFSNQVKEGKAEILTVVNEEKIERFAINIDKVMLQNKPEGKGLVIRITDPRLLSVTGGIVQGMSGSPIIQDGKLIGAVTHVFVNDPTRGYGILAEWMLLEAGIINQQSEKVVKGAIAPFSIL
ncbi:SpoIVB peptidase [Zhaonella formicivorans]|uniref:SpoIVB peptidase n=1 Tax=Zhaonella formicivorans TaxID=2528593 RepID=UPI0010D3A55E|nr:SpoIVB peptidase [Zhaonella formicivorans]